jgi:hypothetical protein
MSIIRQHDRVAVMHASRIEAAAIGQALTGRLLSRDADRAHRPVSAILDLHQGRGARGVLLWRFLR